MSKEILLDIKDNIAIVTFNRPDQYNAISYKGWQLLSETVRELGQENSVKVVIFTGSGNRSFSAGADIKDFESHRYNSDSSKVYSEAFDGALDDIEALPMPTISMIRGICVGGGCELSMATDIRIAGMGSKFGIPVARLGILIGYREMKRLVNLVGPGNASYILLSGRIIGDSEALEMGMITKLVEESELERTVMDLAKEMLPLAPLSQSRHKKILQSVIANQSLNGFTIEEIDLPFTNFDSEDFNEGRKAFIERRPPVFSGA